MILTIKNLKKNDVMPLLLALPKQTMFSLEEVEDAQTTVKGKVGKAQSVGVKVNDQILSLTGKNATAGSAREGILTVLEKLEVEHGIGTVTRKMLREKCSSLGQDSQIIYQLIREGYLKTL